MKQKNEMLDSMPRELTPLFAVVAIISAIFLFPSEPVLAFIILIASLLILFEKSVFHFARIR